MCNHKRACLECEVIFILISFTDCLPWFLLEKVFAIQEYETTEAIISPPLSI